MTFRSRSPLQPIERREPTMVSPSTVSPLLLVASTLVTVAALWVAYIGKLEAMHSAPIAALLALTFGALLIDRWQVLRQAMQNQLDQVTIATHLLAVVCLSALLFGAAVRTLALV